MADQELPGRPHFTGPPQINWSEALTPEAVTSALRRGRASEATDDPAIIEMRANRRVNRMGGIHTASVAGMPDRGRQGSDLSFATPRPRDPMFYWKSNNLPFDFNDPAQLARIREFCRLLYATHPIIGPAIDIFSKYPLTGMELACKDDALVEFHEQLFFDQLNYEEFLVDIGREYWSAGEAWPFAQFNELLGVWEDEELLRPEDITVIKSPFLKEPRFEMRLPETLRQVLARHEPRPEYERLVREYPELEYFVNANLNIPVSNVLLKQIKFKGDTFHPRGVPILLRAFRTIVQEEMLNAAQDSIADRLYTPLILVKLGASANDMGTSQPWIPSSGDMMDFEDALDMALAADFRAIVHHFGVQMDSVFGRETMPDFSADFARIDDRILQVFGLSKTMLSGADQGETYAADALNRDLITQLLTTFQRTLKRHYRDRALVVAEAQEHYDYDEHGGQKTMVMEEVLEVDERGNERIVEQPKLLVPDLEFQAMNMQNDVTFRQLIEELRSSGVPISIKSRMVNIPFDLPTEIEKSTDEQVEMAVAAQEVRLATYKALKDKGLPIPDDLKADFEPKVQQPVDPAAATNGAAPNGQDPNADPDGQVLPSIGTETPAPTEALVPPFPTTTLSDQSDPALRSEDDQAPAATSTSSKLPRNTLRQRQRPEESDEMRAGMPRAAARESDPSGPPQPPQRFQQPWSVGRRRYASVEPDGAPEGAEDIIVVD